MGNRNRYQFGSSNVGGFFAFILERQAIYLARCAGKSKPWTQDPILQKYKFTNIFRQCDRGTIALHNMLAEMRNDGWSDDLCLWTIIWYRLFNLRNHVEDTDKFFKDYSALEKFILAKYRRGHQIFTSAHMTHGSAGESKHITYLEGAKMAFRKRRDYLASIENEPTLEHAFRTMLQNYCVGPFVAYEIVCDLRFTPILQCAADVLTWANIGPGAKRGLERLGLPNTLESVRKLYATSTQILGKEFFASARPHPLEVHPWSDVMLFELREIEHSLCEFDKYERARLGQGKPRSRYPGEPS